MRDNSAIAKSLYSKKLRFFSTTTYPSVIMSKTKTAATQSAAAVSL